MCLCHTVQVKEEETVDGIKHGIHQGKSTSFYISSSPDEVALVEGMKRCRTRTHTNFPKAKILILLFPTCVAETLLAFLIKFSLAQFIVESKCGHLKTFKSLILDLTPSLAYLIYTMTT